jgi:ATP-dependent DNA helicase DinG
MGLNSFKDYMLPEAILKLKQGFGRLIRTKNDIGVVGILDKRLNTKQYGRTIINSLPDTNITSKDSDLIKYIKYFL